VGPKGDEETGVFAPSRGRVSLVTFFSREKKVTRARRESRKLMSYTMIARKREQQKKE
jgi:hypothetical protein